MSSPTKYDLQILEWQQFEVLSFKCLQFEISPSIQFIEGGNDKGRDIIYEGVTNFFDSEGKSRKYLFQVKHKADEINFSSLTSDLKNELGKIYIKHKLNFNYYCLVTNLRLTGDQYDKLRSTFDSFILENNITQEILFSIYSYKHFESCIDRNSSIKWSFPIVVRNSDFKYLLEGFFNRIERNLSQGWLPVIERNKDRFIYTQIYEEADTKLLENHILLLSGPPKSGKTFNAEMLLFNKVCTELFIPYKIDKIEDFFKVYDQDKKQIFLFDDALGKHNIDLYRADILDRRIETIFELINENHKCIFTSREYIYKAFIEYSDADRDKFVSKVIVDVSKLSIGEKESLFRRYFCITFPDKLSLSDYTIRGIAHHKNFSPETIRAYFENNKEFDLKYLQSHLDLPDKYLQNLFSNLTEEKRIILLSILFSLNNEEHTISYSFKNICEDLRKELLINLKNQLSILEDSIIKREGNQYYFYHPSMIEFFITYLGSDIASYRRILFRNLNLSLLNASKFKEVNTSQNLRIKKTDLDDLSFGLNRVIKNPYLTLFDINSIFSWISTMDVQLNFKVTDIDNYRNFMSAFSDSVKELDYSRFFDENMYYLSTFFKNIRLVFDIDTESNFIPDGIIKTIIEKRKTDSDYWLLVFQITPLMKYEFVLQYIDREWLNKFYSELKSAIDLLGAELYGPIYPNFGRKRRGDFLQKTGRTWYPRYKVCKEKMYILKTSKPYGFKIYEKLSTNFEHLRMLEEKQRDRYFFLFSSVFQYFKKKSL